MTEDLRLSIVEKSKVHFPPFKSQRPLSTEEISEIERKCGINTPDLFLEMLSWKLIGKKYW